MAIKSDWCMIFSLFAYIKGEIHEFFAKRPTSNFGKQITRCYKKSPMNFIFDHEPRLTEVYFETIIFQNCFGVWPEGTQNAPPPISYKFN